MKKISLNGQEIEYKLRRNKRSRRLRLCLYPDSSIVVTLPLRAQENLAENFIREKADWLLDKILKIKKSGSALLPKISKADYLKNKAVALKFVEERIAECNKIYGFEYKKIAVKNQKTRWGSCSRKGNLNFNFRLMLLPLRVADYIIVHELCHLEEFNHSGRFWKLVARAVPDYQQIRKELRGGIVK